MIRVWHKHVRDSAGGRGHVRPLRAQLHLEEHCAGQTDDAKYVGKRVHSGLCADDPIRHNRKQAFSGASVMKTARAFSSRHSSSYVARECELQELGRADSASGAV